MVARKSKRFPDKVRPWPHWRLDPYFAVDKIGVAATADALSANLAQMQFLEDARNTLKQLKGTKPGDVH